MKTRLLNFFAVAAMLLVASCSSTDIEESMLPEDRIPGDCVTVDIPSPVKNEVVSRGGDEDYKLNCKVWLFKTSLNGGDEYIVPTDLPVASQEIANFPDNTKLTFTNVEPGYYTLVAFCWYTYDQPGARLVDFYYVDKVGTLDSERKLITSVQMQWNTGSSDYWNFNNDYYLCWSATSNFEKTEDNLSVSIRLDHAVNKVTFETTSGNRTLLQGLNFYWTEDNSTNSCEVEVNNGLLNTMGNYSTSLYIPYNVNKDKWDSYSSGNTHSRVEDPATMSTTLFYMYLWPQTISNFKFLPVSASDDIKYYPVEIESLNLSSPNTLYTVKGNLINVDNRGPNVTVTVNKDDGWNGVTTITTPAE